ncbi:restriction endonuclease subunit S [Lactococcus petauri]|uniref:restriction endonuclease subunit S n=1 Tax=Lactococcus petauri TaxID=1940789 RepID=UPI0025519AE5|nr:restriction endonuclease subunit S [Lactococcus petauri]
MAKIDDSVKKKVPELRFKGFTDEWEQRKLGDEVRIVMGQSPNSENYTDDPNDYILVQGNADMKNGRVFPRVWTTQVTKQAEKDDLILSVRAPVGDIGKTAYDVVIGRGVAAIKGNEFIFQNLGKMKSDGYWTRYSTGSTFESINSTDIKEAIISVPAIEEQDKIGSFFKQLDNTIALHQRKLDLLKEQKKGFLQKMFPKNGAKVPELRFAGFADDWEERKLKDVVEKQIKGKAQFEKLAPGEVEYLDTSRLNGGQAILTNGLKDVTLDDILILWDGSKAGTVYHGFEGALGSTLKAYRTSANSKFVYQYLKRHQDSIYNNYRTPNIPHVQKDFLNVFTISVPVSDEQEKIGSFFKQLDDTIDLHQRKLDLLKEQKKGFLQKMFV